jgi:DNA-damage-inducible protein J
MAKTATLNIRIDPEIKTASERLFSNFGITISDAVSIFLHQSLLVNGLPFEVKHPVPNETTLKAMYEAEHDIDLHRFNTPEEMFIELGIEQA